jgi:hypothetical protein
MIPLEPRVFADNGGVRTFEYKDFGDSGNWASCNGHYNNVHWSTYCDSSSSRIVSTVDMNGGSMEREYCKIVPLDSAFP